MIYVKLHSSGIGVIDDLGDPKFLPPTFQSLENLISKLAPNTTLVVERPFVTQWANNRIYYLFQLYGALKALCGHFEISIKPTNISDAREEVFGESFLTKDFMLTEVNNRFKTVSKGLLPVQELILFDVWTLQRAHHV